MPLVINNFGHIVGQSSDSRFDERRAFLYANGVLHDLNDLIPRHSGWFLFEAFRLYRTPSTARAVGLFRFSILYLFALFLVMTVDALWQVGTFW